MTSCLQWIRLSLAFLVLLVPISGARAGDAYKPTPAAASPAKPSKSDDDLAPPSDESTTDTSDEPSEDATPTPPKDTRPHPAKGKAAPSPTDSTGGDDGQGPTQKPAEGADPDRTLRQMWEEKARKADERVAAAQARLDQAQAAYTNMRTRSYPSGEARAAILKEIDDAKEELSRAQADRASLEDEARAAGVPPSWIMP